MSWVASNSISFSFLFFCAYKNDASTFGKSTFGRQISACRLFFYFFDIQRKLSFRSHLDKNQPHRFDIFAHHNSIVYALKMVTFIALSLSFLHILFFRAHFVISGCDQKLVSTLLKSIDLPLLGYRNNMTLFHLIALLKHVLENVLSHVHASTAKFIGAQ